ncbi:MAG: ATP-dependent zinc metalloprotease FtsH, partial [Oscillospiraceae bacterium]
VYGSDQSEVFIGRDWGVQNNYSEEVASEIDTEIRKIIATAYSKCEDILTEHRDRLDAVASALLAKEKLSGEEFKQIMETLPLPDGENGGEAPAPTPAG